MSRLPPARDLARRFPVTLGIAVVTLGFFALEVWLGGATEPLVHLRLGALQAGRVAENGEYWRLFMPIWIHHGWLHLLLNGMALLQLGALVESIWGGRRLLLYYTICGVAASLTSATLNGATVMGSVGSSGAIMGLAGLIVGTTWYGSEPIRGWLLDLVGRRLLYAVALTFALGIGLWFILPIVDNWAHIGGFACGLLIAAATPNPTQEDLRSSLSAAAAAGAALIGAMVWMGVAGDRPEEEVSLEIARTIAIRVSETPGYWIGAVQLSEMLSWYELAGQVPEGLDAFERALDDLRSPTRVRGVSELMYVETEAGKDRDKPMEIACERWLELAPDDPNALNAMAWHLVTRTNVAARDPIRAEALSRKSLERISDPDTLGRGQRAIYLDTLGEILFVKGEFEEAAVVQSESIQLAHAVDEDRWPVIQPRLPIEIFEERLHKIEQAASG